MPPIRPPIRPSRSRPPGRGGTTVGAAVGWFGGTALSQTPGGWREIAGRYHAASPLVKAVGGSHAPWMQPAETPPSARFAGKADPLDWSRIAAAGSLATVEHLVEAASTMHRARELAAVAGREELPAIVLADRQMEGHGRRGAGWWQAAGSLAMTLVVDPAWLGWSEGRGSPAAAGWSLACGVALAESIREHEPSLAVGVRWPNDVEVGGRKLAGILAETSASSQLATSRSATSRSATSRVLFGIGVNTAGHGRDAPPELRDRLVTIPDLTGRLLPRQRLLETFLPRLWQLLAQLGDEPELLTARYRPLCTLTGTTVTLYQGSDRVRGTCLGIDSNGAILIRTGDVVVRQHAGSLTPPGREWQRGVTQAGDQAAS